ncbi:MAG: hypothetical protein PHY82_10285 [Lentisphaeria bacterium]|nr:hypothetical protein [Lentisphaeria bacterium]
MMKLKSWIDELETAEGEPESGAQIEPGDAPAEQITFDLLAAADRLLLGARDAIIRGGVYNWKTAECEAAELDINKTYKAILNGGRDFAALREACARWVLAARIKPRALPAEQSTLPTGEGQGKP